jgi:hypothetical protein
MVRQFPLFLLFVILSAQTVHSQQPDLTPTVEGYVTRVTSLSDFDVNDFHVIPGKETIYRADNNKLHQSHVVADAPYLGQAVTVSGDVKKKTHQILAKDVLFHLVDTTSRSGIALVDRVLTPATPGNIPLRLLVRADGYIILINPRTKISFQSPLISPSDVTANVWIQYHGQPQSDGILLADTAAFSQNTVQDKEAKLLDKSDYDPAAVDPNAKQNVAHEFFLGIDPKKIPPYNDPAMQSRINQIGSSLIPAFQKNLPDTDDRKILFKFQLIDNHKWKDARTLPTGIILIPYQLINRLQNDSQIAALLADNMATALEKQSYRLMPARSTMGAANIATTAGGLFIPGLGLATGAATYTAEKKIETNLLNQSGRVSLGLLHDAGYDINQAPVAWWILAKDAHGDLATTSLPPRAANLYQSLGSTWRNYSEAPNPSSTTLETK